MYSNIFRVLDLIEIPIYISDIHSNRVVYINKQGVKFLGAKAVDEKHCDLLQMLMKVNERIIKKEKMKDTRESMEENGVVFSIRSFIVEEENGELFEVSILIKDHCNEIYNDNIIKKIIQSSEYRDRCYYMLESINKSFAKLSKTNEMYLVFQPKINISNSRVYGYEVLCRWCHPVLGNISPLEFIEFIASINKMREFDLFVFQEAFKFQKELSERGTNHKCSVNITVESFRNKESIEKICDLADAYGVLPERIIIEVLEQHGLENDKETLENFLILKNKGFKISIDDFGTGYSMFNRINTIDFDEIKIPREFIVGAKKRSKQYKILEAILVLARGLELDTVVEGVELEEQLNIIREIGFDKSQGFLHYKPLTRDEYMKVCCELLTQK